MFLLDWVILETMNHLINSFDFKLKKKLIYEKIEFLYATL